MQADDVTSRGTYVQLVHRLMRHFAFTYGGFTGRRCEEVINARYADIGLQDEPGLPEGRTPVITVGHAKNNTDGARQPVIQILFPVYSNMFVDPGLVSCGVHAVAKFTSHVVIGRR